jgi:hypothetical protein
MYSLPEMLIGNQLNSFANVGNQLQGAMGQMAGMNLANAAASQQNKNRAAEYGYRDDQLAIERMKAEAELAQWQDMLGLRKEEMGMKSRLLELLGGMAGVGGDGAQGGGTGGGMGGGLQGFYDTNSAQRASLPNGNYTTAVTAKALPQSTINAASKKVANTQPTMPMTSVGVGPQQDQLYRQLAGHTTAAGARNGVAMNQGLTSQNADLERNIAALRARLGLDNANALAGVNEDNARRGVALRNSLLKVGGFA